jgi:hypothetical protein
MRTALLTAGTLALFGFGLTIPASAQMCGGSQQAQASTPGQGGMCGMGQPADDPMADKPAQKPQAGGMMCPCCKNMAMMRGGSGMGGGMQHHNMPGMDMPKPQ